MFTNLKNAEVLWKHIVWIFQKSIFKTGPTQTICRLETCGLEHVFTRKPRKILEIEIETNQENKISLKLSLLFQINQKGLLPWIAA